MSARGSRKGSERPEAGQPRRIRALEGLYIRSLMVVGIGFRHVSTEPSTLFYGSPKLARILHLWGTQLLRQIHVVTAPQLYSHSLELKP